MKTSFQARFGPDYTKPDPDQDRIVPFLSSGHLLFGIRSNWNSVISCCRDRQLSQTNLKKEESKCSKKD